MTTNHKMEGLHPLFSQYLVDFKNCENKIKKHSKSFYAAFSRLPQEKALSVYAIYAFCREVDDTIDLYKDKKQLAKLKQELVAFEQGNIPNRPFWRALWVVFQVYPMEIAPFYEMIKGQEIDANFRQPANQEDLETYCYYVASTVGFMLLPLLSSQPLLIKEQVKALGIAMQLTNILRDVGDDLENQKIYFPLQMVLEFNYSCMELKKKSINSSFIELWEFVAKRAEDLYDFSETMLPYIEEDCREPLLLSILYYREILSVVRENGYDCFNSRHYVGKDRKLSLYFTAKKKLKEIMSSF